MNAINVPLQKDQVEAWRRWAAECTGPRRKDFADFNRRMGLTEHRAWLDLGPGGPQIIVLHGGPGADTFMKRLATSGHPFDTWFRENITRFHGHDFRQPLDVALPERVIDWSEQGKTRKAEA